MKTWQKQGGSSSTEKHSKVLLYDGNTSADTFASKLLEGIDIDAIHWNYADDYAFTGWGMTNNVNLGIVNYAETANRFESRNYRGTLGTYTTLVCKDNDILNYHVAKYGKLHYIYRIFKISKTGAIPYDCRSLIEYSLWQEPIPSEIEHNGRIMRFLWNYKIPGYSNGNEQYRHRNHYYAVPGYGASDADEDDTQEVDGIVYPLEKPSAQFVRDYHVPGTSVATLALRGGYPLSFGQGFNFPVYFCKYNWEIYYNYDIRYDALPLTPWNKYVRRGFNKILMGHSTYVKERTNDRIVVAGFLFLGE